MKTSIEQTNWLIEKLGFKYIPVGLKLVKQKPENAVHFKKAGNGCIAPLIFSASKGKTIAIDKESTGYACSACYLGNKDWVFDGIEYFLSHSTGNQLGRESERFVKSPAMAKEYVKSFVSDEMYDGAYLFKPINLFAPEEKPEVVIFYANADLLSALVFLIHYNHPFDTNRVVTGFASACMAIATIPLRYVKNNESKAFWGMHDISVRPSMPKEIMTIAMPFGMFEEICSIAEESFLNTEKWNKVLERNRNEE